MDVPSTANAPRARRNPALLPMLADIGWRIGSVAILFTLAATLIYFPWSSDNPLTPAQMAELRQYYATAYAKPGAAEENENSRYVQIAKLAAEYYDIKGQVSRFVAQYGLEQASALDVGAGRGYLQDVVENYTGLDISPSAKRFFHKQFVLASATSMPFAPGRFDAAWSIWVLEHIPNPEAALSEMRRVLKDGGLLFLLPAWDCTPWAAQGYPARPYGDFGVGGKLVKASIPAQLVLWEFARGPIHTARAWAWRAGGGPSRFHYRRLTPNYDQYWMPDSDAVNSLDRHETALWFVSRGDECLNCGAFPRASFPAEGPLIIRVRHRPARTL